MKEIEYEYRPLKEEERKYTFSQSTQISSQTGFIGYLRADFGKYGTDFYSTWNDFRKDLNTDEFKEDFDSVINSLRDSDILSNRAYLAGYCERTPKSAFGDKFGEGRNLYGVRLDTEKYSYLMRLCPNKGDYNLYCYCYVKDWLNDHMERARRGIRFIDSGYNEKFRIADGDKIIMRFSNGTASKRVCRYIDDYHVEVGDNLYHICQLAELCEQYGHTVEPAEKEDNPKTQPKRNKEFER